MTRACEQKLVTARGRGGRRGVLRSGVAFGCQRTSSRERRRAGDAGWLLAMLLGVSSCNSLLGIREASLTCDDPPCADEARGSDTISGNVDEQAVDGGAASESGSGTSNTAGRGDEPAVSGIGSDGIPVAPVSPPQIADPSDEDSESGGASEGASGSGGVSGAGGAPSSGGASPSGGASGAGAGAGQTLCDSGDACGNCLCEACEQEMALCTSTQGCLEILACARNSGCNSFACYCGTADLLQCAITDLANGPCLAVMLAAPGSHPPSLVDPNAGPASEAALGVANCSGQSCAAACGN